jgi:hypothetical protein
MIHFWKMAMSDRYSGDTIFSKFLVSCLQDDQVTLACEVLKTLFNLTVKSREQLSVDEKEAEDAWLLHLASVLHDFLLCETRSRDKRCELHK